MANALHMHAKLVRAAGNGFEFYQTGGVARLQHSPATLAGFAIWMDDVQWPIGPIQQYRTFNQGPSISVFFSGFRLADHYRHVALMYLSCFKSLAYSALRFNTTRHDE